MLKKIMAVLLLSILCAVSMSWASGQQEESGEAKTISLFSFKAAPHEKAALDMLVEGYESENPGVKVEVEVVSHSAGFENVMDTRLVSGQMADIFMEVSAKIHRTIDAGYVAPISGAGFLDSYLDSGIGLATRDGEIYGFPTEYVSVSMWYNQKILDDCGLDYPETWDEFIAACEIVKAKGYDPMVLANEQGVSAQFFITPLARDMIYNNYDPDEFIAGVNDGKNFFSEVYKEAFERFQLVGDKDFYAKADSLGWFIGEEGIQEFARGNAAFFPGGNWFTALFDDADPSGNIKMGPTPMTLDHAKASVQPQSYMLIYSDSKKQETAKDFMAYVTQEEVMIPYVKSLSALSPLKAPFTPDNPRMQPIADAIAAGNTVPWNLPAGLVIGEDVADVRELVQEMVVGRIDAATAAERMDASITRKINLSK